MRETCYRYKASVNPYRQSYFSEVVKDDKDEDGNHSCGYYWELDKRGHLSQNSSNKNQNIMKTFAVVFIPKHRLNEDDSSDFKQWKHVEGNDKESVINQVSEHGIVIECREIPG